MGDYYADAHGIPTHHICPLAINTNLATLTSNEFHSLVRSPITNYIATNGLSGQINFVVLCQDFPTRVDDSEGLSASLFYGFQNAPSYWSGGCNLPATTSNEYFRSEQTFRSSDEWNATNGFIAFHLIASNLPTAKLVVDRGAAAQTSFPAGAIYLYILGDQARGVREQLFANTQFSFRSLPDLPIPCEIPPYYAYPLNKTNIIGYQDGFPSINWWMPHNTWLDGAYADHLTSYGGRISRLTNQTTHATVLNWMGIGVTASYGTVDEPCAYLEKFPDPLMGFYYARGFTIGEAYAMAVEAPYQGLFAGDPLAAPFAAPPTITVTSQVPYQIITGTVPVQVSAIAHSNGVPAASLDLFLDERFHTNLVTLVPTEDNELFMGVGTRTNTAIVSGGDSLYDAVAALADAINADTTQTVSAVATGDRIELIYKEYTHDGDHLPVTASVNQGAASALTLQVGLAATNLVPSIYPARTTLHLGAHTNGYIYSPYANTGDTITCTITLTNGVAVTNIVVATYRETLTSLTERLYTAISNNATLTATNGVRFDRLARSVPNIYPYQPSFALFARTPGSDGAGILVAYIVTPVTSTWGLRTNFNSTTFLRERPDDIRSRAAVLFHVAPTNDILDNSFSLDTTLLSDGIHTVDFVARDGSAVAAPSRLTLPLLICNSSPQLSLLGTNGVAITNGEPTSLTNGTDFGPVDGGQSFTNIFSLHNNGTAALSITGWTTNGTGAHAFAFSGIPSVIEVGGSSNCTVVFSPSAASTFQASLNIESDAILAQTNLLFAGTGVVYTLTVASEHGTATPSVGIHTNLQSGTLLTNSITAPAAAGGTQRVSVGWAMTGQDPLSGGSTQFVMTVTNNATLTWLWTTNYWLDTAAGEHGSVNVADAWQPGGVTTQITASADLYYHFTNWTGDASGSDNPLSLLMDAPQTIQANFTENLAAQETPEWWLAGYGWTSDFDAVATNDADSDGYFTWQEYICDTDPTNPASVFLPMDADGSATNFTFTFFQTSTGRNYSLDLTSAPLTNPAWNSVTSSIGNGTNWIPQFTPPGTGLHFYRGTVSHTP